ncbi:MAG: hypothetical protein R3218_05585 [Christiangramia sp.]|nr:hypothetical protein [Christiangramia sp.]
MIPAKLKQTIYSKRIRKAINGRVKNSNSGNGKIGIITDAEDTGEIRSLLKLSEELGFKNSKLKLVLSGTEAEIPGNVNGIYLNPKEVSISGKFRSEEIKSFAAENFEILICYLREKQNPGLLLAAESKASLVFGNSPDDFGLYDVEIKTGGIEDFQQEIKKYYRIFKRQ